MRRFRFGNFGNEEKPKASSEIVPFGWFDVDNIFEGLFNLEGFFKEPIGFGLLGIARRPRLDIYEKDNKVVVKADLPGMDKKDINIRLEGDILTISGDKKLEREVKKDDYYHVERSYGKIQRSVRLPHGLKEDQIKASYRDGVLTVEIPKSDEEVERGRSIEIE